MTVARLIPLRRRDNSVVAHAIVDDADFEELSRWRWHLTDKGYARRREYLGKIDGRYRYRDVFLHQQLLGQRYVDHKDGNPLNNVRANLRPCPRGQLDNGQNRRVKRTAASGIRGVSRCGKGWKATVQVDGEPHYLGYSLDPEALRERVEAFRAEHMPFSREAA